MILNCPSCSSKYVVDPSAIGAVGRIVRCANCSHSWFQSAAEEAPKPEASAGDPVKKLERQNQNARPIPEGSGLPVLSKGAPVPPALKVAVAAVWSLVLLIAVFTFRAPVMHAVPFTATIYNWFGIYDTSGVVLADVSYVREPAEKKDRFVIKGSIVNESDSSRTIPVLRVSLTDDTGDELQYWELKKEGAVIAAGENIAFSNVLEGTFDNEAALHIELGSPFELMIRR